MTTCSILISRTDYRRLLDLLDQAADTADGAVLDLVDRKLFHGQVVDPAAIPPDVATMNSCLAYRRHAGDDVRKVALAYPAEAEPSAHRISILSPLGASLLGAREGDRIEWGRTLPIHPVRLERVIYQPEAAGDWHR